MEDKINELSVYLNYCKIMNFRNMSLEYMLVRRDNVLLSTSINIRIQSHKSLSKLL